MNKETLKKANELYKDIENISEVIEESEKEKKWIKVITPKTEKRERYFSVRFQDELTDWLKTKREEYQKEFDNLEEE